MWAQTVTLHQISSMISKCLNCKIQQKTASLAVKHWVLLKPLTFLFLFFLTEQSSKRSAAIKITEGQSCISESFGESAGSWALIIVLLQPVELSVTCICQTWHGSIFMSPAAVHRSQSGAPCPVHCGFAKISFGIFMARIHCWHWHAEFQKWNTLPRLFKCGTFFYLTFFFIFFFIFYLASQLAIK